jgi:D-proline reductase (dithiol) PrdE
MDTIVDMNKNPEGIETNIVGENAVDRIDARKATAMLKLKMRKR